jgi:uncharacterized membrane protein
MLVTVGLFIVVLFATFVLVFGAIVMATRKRGGTIGGGVFR